MQTVLLALLQVIVASGILYGYYHFFLRNKQFHQYNRFFLLGSVVISIAIPFLKIPVYFSAPETEASMVITTLQTITGGAWEDDAVVQATADANTFNWSLVIRLAYLAVALIFFCRIVIGLWRIHSLIRKHRVEKLDGIKFVNTGESGTPFSFFRWLFWHRRIELSSSKGEQIFRHEIFHIQQKHSWDIIFIEVVSMCCWINPFFHIIRKEIRAIHEFLADRFAVDEKEKWNYAELLLMQALETRQTLVNPFFHNQIKRRIAMITNPQKTSHRYLRKLLVLPVAALVTTLFAFQYKTSREEAAHWGPPMTVAIDAGYPKRDRVAVSPDKHFAEADISMSLAQTIERLAPEYNISILLNRYSTNHTAPADPRQASVLQDSHLSPDAYVALHVNTTAETTYQESASGFDAFVSGKRNDPKGALLASAILGNLESIYKTDHRIRLTSTTGKSVIDQTSIPAVILRCGYINNRTDMDFVNDNDNQEVIARKILQALRDFHNNSDQLIPSLEKVKEVALTDTTPRVKEVKLTGVQLRPSLLDSTLKLSITNTPLYIVDGVIVKDFELNSVEPNSIKSINVLKGTSAAVYGDAGKHGVIQITTKGDQPVTKLTLSEPVEDLNEVVVVGYGTKNKTTEKIFTNVEVAPGFEGGDVAWRKYLERNLNGNIPVDNHAPAGKYTVRLQFVIDKNGEVSNVRALTRHGFGMEEEAIRVLHKGPKWIPAKQNGQNVAAVRRQPITFMVMAEESEQVIKKVNGIQLQPSVKGETVEEVIVTGYKKQPLQEVTITGVTKQPDKEVTVTGYRKEPLKEVTILDNKVDEVTVTGKKRQPLEEVTVTGFKKTNGITISDKPEALQEVTVTGQKKEQVREVAVSGYQTKRDDLMEKSIKLPQVFPNPTNGQAKIALSSEESGEVVIAVFDMHGKYVTSLKTGVVKGNNTLTVPTSDLSAGTYLIGITAPGKKHYSCKLVKE